MSDGKNKDEDNISKEDINDVGERVYELGYLLVPTIPAENVPISYGNLKDLVISQGGEVISDEIPKEIELAYMMSKVVKNVRSKFNSAYFGWIKFEMNPEQVLELKKKLDLDHTLIRFLILKTVRENTIAAKRFIQKDFRRKMPITKSEREEVGILINKEEIDKEIDAMVAA